ncbi:hypothetical protein BDV26DRAFT_258870 [Aspergillus bertholletiae]|uniref:Uncharacterized protein n=1 Tax=Aspergillus bertholletiae TaxID=1226010 RepID=A0A5N7BCZ2_9EURO|nr:hypothetical protein BDV26DRAFT_258870 [Aspergillus bertholletiae]
MDMTKEHSSIQRRCCRSRPWGYLAEIIKQVLICWIAITASLGSCYQIPWDVLDYTKATYA